MKTIISADDLAKDVAGAESLLEKHQEHKVGSMLRDSDVCLGRVLYEAFLLQWLLQDNYLFFKMVRI